MKVVLVFDGDSISLGVGASHGHTLSDQILPLLPTGVNSHVVAAGGRSVKDCLDLFEINVKPLYDSNAGLNIIFFHAGDNDIAYGRNAEETYDLIKSYTKRAHNQGWIFIGSTKLQRYDWPDSFRAVISLLNKLIIDNSAGANSIVDFQSESIMGSHESRLDRTYYTLDGVHPADVGYKILANILFKNLLSYVSIEYYTTNK